MDVTVKFSEIEDIKAFVNCAMQYDYDIDIKSNQYVVDGKSILGIFSLNLDGVLTVTIYGDPDSAAGFAKQIEKFIVA